MGVISTIGFDKYPTQCDKSTFGGVGTKVRVSFNYDTSNLLEGEIVRDDKEFPYVTIIKLPDGRYISY